MNIKIKNSNSDVMISELQEIIIAIESLEEYFSNSIKLVQKKQLEIESKYELGLFIDEKFANALKIDDSEEFSQYIVSLNSNKTFSGKTISDYITIEYELDENKQPQNISYSIKPDSSIESKYIDPKIARREHSKVTQYQNMLINSTLSQVIIIFERYLSSVYEALIFVNPKKYFENQKIEIASIFNKNVKDIVIESVKKEVESNMFDSLKALEMISQKEKIDINRYCNIQTEFEEIYYRRNLYIHNNGKVNNIYLSNINEKYKKKIKIDDTLVTDEIYLKNAINMLFKIVCTLFYEIQLNYNPKYDRWNMVLGNIGFDFLQKKNYNVAEQIYFCLSKTKQFCFKDKAMFRINYINSLKQQGKLELVKKELSELDVSIATEDFRIAKLCLEDKNDEVYSALCSTYPNVYSANLIRDWPIFINFRSSKFYDNFVKEHQDDFGIFIFEKDDENSEPLLNSNNKIESN